MKQAGKWLMTFLVCLAEGLAQTAKFSTFSSNSLQSEWSQTTITHGYGLGLVQNGPGTMLSSGLQSLNFRNFDSQVRLFRAIIYEFRTRKSPLNALSRTPRRLSFELAFTPFFYFSHSVFTKCNCLDYAFEIHSLYYAFSCSQFQGLQTFHNSYRGRFVRRNKRKLDVL